MADWALITGASEGLGREFAGLAARDGFHLILSARQVDKLDVLAATLRQAHGIEVVVIGADLAQAAEAERLWAEATEGRKIVVLVNNAGLGRNGDFADPEGWAREEASVAVNVVAATILMKRAVVAMVGQGAGRVLNVASVAGFLAGPHMAVYHATKAYFLSLSEGVAAELRGTGVTVTALCPGPVATQFFAADGAEGATIVTRMGMKSPASVAAAGWSAMQRGQGVIVPGIDNKILTVLPRLLPRKIVTFFTGQFLKRRW